MIALVRLPPAASSKRRAKLRGVSDADADNSRGQGRNQIFQMFLLDTTGQHRERKKVSSHLGVLRDHVIEDMECKRFVDCKALGVTDQIIVRCTLITGGGDDPDPVKKPRIYERLTQKRLSRPSTLPSTSCLLEFQQRVMMEKPGLQVVQDLDDSSALWDLENFSMSLCPADQLQQTIHKYTTSSLNGKIPTVNLADRAWEFAQFPELFVSHRQPFASINRVIAVEATIQMPNITKLSGKNELVILLHLRGPRVDGDVVVDTTTVIFESSQHEVSHHRNFGRKISDTCSKMNDDTALYQIPMHSSYWATLLYNLGTEYARTCLELEQQPHLDEFVRTTRMKAVTRKIEDITAVQYISVYNRASPEIQQRITLRWRFKSSPADVPGKVNWCTVRTFAIEALQPPTMNDDDCRIIQPPTMNDDDGRIGSNPTVKGEVHGGSDGSRMSLNESNDQEEMLTRQSTMESQIEVVEPFPQFNYVPFDWQVKLEKASQDMTFVPSIVHDNYHQKESVMENAGFRIYEDNINDGQISSQLSHDMPYSQYPYPSPTTQQFNTIENHVQTNGQVMYSVQEQLSRVPTPNHPSLEVDPYEHRHVYHEHDEQHRHQQHQIYQMMNQLSALQARGFGNNRIQNLYLNIPSASSNVDIETPLLTPTSITYSLADTDGSISTEIVDDRGIYLNPPPTPLSNHSFNIPSQAFNFATCDGRENISRSVSRCGSVMPTLNKAMLDLNIYTQQTHDDLHSLPAGGYSHAGNHSNALGKEEHDSCLAARSLMSIHGHDMNIIHGL